MSGTRRPRGEGVAEEIRRRAPKRPLHPWESGLRDFSKLLSLCQALELLQRLVLDLADALARDVERPPDLVQSAWMLTAEPVPQLQHATLPVRQVLERLAQGLLGE